MAVLSGCVSALAIVTWFSAENDSTAFFTPAQSHTDEPLSDTLTHTVLQKTVTVFDRRGRISYGVYTAAARLFDAALLSADGWSVAALPATLPAAGDLIAVTQSGSEHRVQNMLRDTVSGLVYLRLDGSEFKIVEFADRPSSELQPLFAVGAGGATRITLARAVSDRSVPDSAPLIASFVRPSVRLEEASGQTLIVDATGALAGVVGRDSTFIDSRYVEAVLSSVLKNGKISYQSLSAEVRPLYGRLSADDGGAFRYGLLVVRVRAGSGPLFPGDTILSIAGVPVDLSFLPFAIFEAPDPVPLTVLRAGERLDILVPKQQVSL